MNVDRMRKYNWMKQAREFTRYMKNYRPARAIPSIWLGGGDPVFDSYNGIPAATELKFEAGVLDPYTTTKPVLGTFVYPDHEHEKDDAVAQILETGRATIDLRGTTVSIDYTNPEHERDDRE